MTSKEWVAKVQENSGKLVELIAKYHPGSRSSLEGFDDMPITASIPEKMCKVMRQEIKEKTVTSPVQDFMNALTLEDVSEIYSIFSKTWIGVPESTSCWNIPGFSIMVDLMDDPPDELMDGKYEEPVLTEEEKKAQSEALASEDFQVDWI